MAEPRKLAEGWRPIKLLVQKDVTGSEVLDWQPVVFLARVCPDGEVDELRIRENAPPECFAPEPPKPLAVDDVVVAEGHHGLVVEPSDGGAQVRFGNNHRIFYYGRSALHRIGHLDRASADR